jgi:ATP-dependent RNA helicase RhlE
MSFQSLNVIQPILDSLAEEGYVHPTPIQSQAIPVVLGKTDLLGCAQTGTGKTAAFAIPILQLLSSVQPEGRKRRIRSLIVTPTRELAIQIGDSFKVYGRYLNLRHTTIYGGVSQYHQTVALQKGIDIVVATPGRLLDLMNQGYISLKDVEIFVMDEADRMLDMGFLPDIRRIISALPSKRQTLFFSATMPPEIVKLSSTILTRPERIEVTPSASVVDTIGQFMYFVDKNNKNALLIDLLKEKAIKTALVFTRTKYGADRVMRLLTKNSIKAEAIHSDKSQNARQRALSNFKSRTTQVLVATDIAARGIDVDNLEVVINFEIPNTAETYVHRIGRTGRAGAAGTAFSFCDMDEKSYLRDIEKLINQKIPVVEDHPYHLHELARSVSLPKEATNRNATRRTFSQKRNSRYRYARQSR